MRRALGTAATLLLLGAIVTIAVAWSSAAWHYVGRQPRLGAAARLDENTSWSAASYRSATAHRFHSIWGSLLDAVARADGHTRPSELLGGWSATLAPGADGSAAGARVVDTRGWPMLSMWSALELEPIPEPIQATPNAWSAGIIRVKRGVEIGPYAQYRLEAPPHRHRILPLGIIWIGFAVDTAVFASAAALLLASISLSRRALRGGRGRCTRCAYDLRTAEIDRCPECGVTIRASAIGSAPARRLRRAIIVIWVAASAGVFAGGGVRAWSWFSASDWSAYKPTWWLVANAKSDDERTSTRTLVELLRRMQSDELSDETIVSLVRDAIALQADIDRVWRAQWGDVVTAARSKELVSDEDWRTFVKQSYFPSFQVRPVIVAGDPVVATLFVHIRAPSESVVALKLQEGETRLGNASFVPPRGAHTTQLSQPSSTMTPPFPTFRVYRCAGQDPLHPHFPFWHLMADVEPGEHLVETRWHAAIAVSATNVLAEREIELKAPVRVLPKGSETVELVRDDSWRPAVKASLSLRYCRARRGPIMSWTRDGIMHHDSTRHTTIIEGMFDMRSPPIDLAFDVFVRADGKEWPAGRIDTESEHPWDFSGMFRGDVEGFDGERVDVILRSSTAAARETLRITRIWDGTIEFENVPVEWK